MDKEITLNGQKVTLSQFEEAKNSLASDERIIETAPNTYEIIKRLRG